ncbi:5'-3' exonuclease [Vibrio crassostreae]|uniref:5'-3' exonuclease n=1 Tax=Vibrio crassostreae TaxID=246167 RepID=UPI001B30F6A4|nr:5'-3' exonuclease H3TH domain-containing protein [Vibrio crassostreae]
MNKEITLFLFDASSHFSRVYKKGEDDGALDKPANFVDGKPIFALSSTIGNVVNQAKAVQQLLGKRYTHIACVLDHEGENFRHRLFPDYKGNRPPKPEAFQIQRKLLPHYMMENGFPVLKIEDVESDDVIGTIVHKCRQSPVTIKVVIFTRDKDLYQLIDDNVMIYDGKELIDTSKVIEKKGVVPNKIADMLALVGDTADNIEGVQGVGEKTAVKVLQHMSFDDIVANPEELLKMDIRNKKAIVANITKDVEHAKLQKQLTDLKLDLDLGMNLNQFVKRSGGVNDIQLFVRKHS